MLKSEIKNTEFQYKHDNANVKKIEWISVIIRFF